MTRPYSSRSESIGPFWAMEVMERGMAMARSGIDVVQLDVGEPGFPPPPEVIGTLSDLGVPLLSDEIYDGLLFDGRHQHVDSDVDR